MGAAVGAIVIVVGLNVAVLTAAHTKTQHKNMEPVTCLKAGGDYVGYHDCYFKK